MRNEMECRVQNNSEEVVKMSKEEVREKYAEGLVHVLLGSSLNGAVLRATVSLLMEKVDIPEFIDKENIVQRFGVRASKLVNAAIGRYSDAVEEQLIGYLENFENNKYSKNAVDVAKLDAIDYMAVSIVNEVLESLEQYAEEMKNDTSTLEVYCFDDSRREEAAKIIDKLIDRVVQTFRTNLMLEAEDIARVLTRRIALLERKGVDGGDNPPSTPKVSYRKLTAKVVNTKAIGKKHHLKVAALVNTHLTRCMLTYR